MSLNLSVMNSSARSSRVLYWGGDGGLDTGDHHNVSEYPQQGFNQLLTQKEKQLLMEGQRDCPLRPGILLQEIKGAHRGCSALYRLQWSKRPCTHTHTFNKSVNTFTAFLSHYYHIILKALYAKKTYSDKKHNVQERSPRAPPPPPPPPRPRPRPRPSL